MATFVSSAFCYARSARDYLLIEWERRKSNLENERRKDTRIHRSGLLVHYRLYQIDCPALIFL